MGRWLPIHEVSMFTPDEAQLIEYCLEQMYSDIAESADSLNDYKSILKKIQPLANVNNYNNSTHTHRRRDLDTL